MAASGSITTITHLEPASEDPEQHGQVRTSLDTSRAEDVDRETVLGLLGHRLEEWQVHHIPEDLREEVVPARGHEKLRAGRLDTSGIKGAER